MKSIGEHFSQWKTPDNFLRINTLDCHTGGEPLRIITHGFPKLIGKSILAKRRYCKQNHDDLRKALIFEPRGHADMYGAILVEPERHDSDFGALFIHNEGYSSMCGHAVIALTKIAVESGFVAKTGSETRVVIDVPCGQIVAKAYGNSDVIDKVSFDCVPSFVLEQNQSIELDGFGNINFDIAFGGAFYVYLDVGQLGLTCDPSNYNALIEIGRQLKFKVADAYQITHPFEPDLSFLYGTIFIDKMKSDRTYSRNVCVFADGEVDRSPTGSGVCGRVAIHIAKEEIKVGENIIVESILGSQFEAVALSKIPFAGHDAIIPRVTGKAHVCARNEFIIDPSDPLKNGFMLR